MANASDRSAETWDLRGRTLAITGATGGIAGAILDAAAGEGVRLILHARDPDAGEDLAGRLRSRGAEARVVPGDLVEEPEAVARRLAEAAEIDVLILNAGVYTQGDLLGVSLDDARRTVEINALAPWAAIQAVLPGMNARGFGRVVAISSGAGSFGEGLASGQAAYAVSKAALNAVTALAAGAARGDVLVNAMCPGWVRTRMGGSGAARSPEEGADTALWLATLPAGGPHGGFFRDRAPIPW